MDKKIQSRIQKLDFLLKKMDKLHLKEAASILNISEMTIRRDLNTHKGSIVLLGGYIVRDPHLREKNNYLIFEQETKNIAEKMHIGKIAASLVEEDDIIFFDCGSTIPFIASQIDPTIKFTALCCSINTFMVLQERSNCEIILCGGNYSRNNSFFSPIQNHSIIDSICTTKSFISAAGIDPEKGVTCFDFNEAMIKQKAMKKSGQNILVFDSTKMNTVHKAYVNTLNSFDVIICDKNLPVEFGNEIPNVLN
ncbi:DeoR family transcriptional regulator [Bisgaardia hudsonensis]|uniref:DeoR family transcriptional regulator n=1 Tax=Bisgaardia hudsonensis TaxID=109472 RepID=A0A4R2N2F1_9PAST|nr:DNA-binding transcriptional repressor DeoR [Bisgaardia hudsonensis]QLB12499.1 DNA-binding transcriptional repressor DeoR [Bisgaardia hudsonensis]TCP14038.1 DeoR family transcriptional regulator [Bisgaardia hudsonensis]